MIKTRLRPIAFLFISLSYWLSYAALAETSSSDLLSGYLPQGCYQTGQYQQQKSIAGINKLLETQGSFAFACDKGLLWHTATPLNETLVYQLQGKTRLIHTDGSNQFLSGTLQRHLGNMLNNLMGGNRTYLEKTFFIVATDTGIRLTPRKKRMEKFLRAIDISRSTDMANTDAANKTAVNIRMQHQGDEFTAIRVYQTHQLSTLTQVQCEQITTNSDSPLGFACQQLLTP
jgi:hypothetical protein